MGTNGASWHADQSGYEEEEQFLVVGIGASAGGIGALKSFFERVPRDSGIAYVVILHLSPDYDSQLAAALQPFTAMPVAQVQQRTLVQPDHVYIVPPNQHLAMVDGHITASPHTDEEDRRAPVDIFFRTLAESHGTRAVAVILSGTGANGSMGLKRVKEDGGIVLVQQPREAAYDEMPRNAIATDLVDEVLPVAEIPARIISYKYNKAQPHIQPEIKTSIDDQEQTLHELLTQLRIRTGHDFSNYKRPTLLRRIERRINIRNLQSLSAYAAYISKDAEEIHALLRDLLISVTNFFRDKKAFEELEQQVLPAILKNKTASDQLRIWVAGCATGEEAYSIAMLCAEQTLSRIDVPRVQIFATDIDEAAIAIAREGYYTLNDAADISPERLRRFFSKEGEGYRIRREIRETILFATHNFLKDPPFSHLDLVSCRNVMIYLNQVAQERVLETFHFALHPGAYLFLGSSESANMAAELYAPLSRDYHIFQTRRTSMRSYPVPETTPGFRFGASGPSDAGSEQTRQTLERITFGDLHQRLLEEYAPPSVVINEEHDIVHLSERAGRYLQLSGGEPSKNLLKLIRQELRLELRSALYQAVQRQAPVEVRGLKLRMHDHTESINIQVRPVLRDGDEARGFILVLFEPANSETRTEQVVFRSDEPVARQLEEELVRLKAQLRASVEQHEFHAEELKASNEELQAMNEELRSAAEELETSKEELQSINEELRTVNQELKVKIEEVSLTSNNLQNLINSADIGTIFLDRSLRIALFTPAARALFNLIPADNGRPLSDITHRLTYKDLLQDAEQVLEKLSAAEREVTSKDGRIFLMRMLPYRTAEDHINGVVISFIDITARKLTEEALRASEEQYRSRLEAEVTARTTELAASRERYASLLENMPDVVTCWDKELKLIYANEAFEAKTGVPNESMIGKTKREIVQDDGVALPYMDSLQRVFDTGEPAEHFNPLATPHGITYFYSRMVPEKDASGAVQSVLTIARDITALKATEQALIERNQSLSEAQALGHIGSFYFDAANNQVTWSDELYRMMGVPAGESLDFDSAIAFYTGENRQRLAALAAASLATGERFQMEAAFVRRGEMAHRYLFLRASVVRDDAGNGIAIKGIVQDITERKRASLELIKIKELLARKATDKYQLILDNMDQGFCIVEVLYDKDGGIGDCRLLEANLAFEKQTGFRNTAGMRLRELDPHMGPQWIRLYGSVIQSGVPVHFFQDAQHLGDYYYEVFALPVSGQEGNQVAIFFNNIAGRRQAEAELQQANERFRIAEDASKGFIYDWDIRTDHITRSDGFTRVLGYTPEELHPANNAWIEIVHPEDLSGINIPSPDNFKDGQDHYTLEYRTLHKNGHYVYMLDKGVVIRDAAGNVTRIVGSATDITDRKKNEEALRIAGERYRTALQSAEMAAWDWYVAEDRIMWNEQHYTILGLAQDEGEKKIADFLKRIHPEDLERTRATLMNAVHTAGVYQAEFRIIRADNAAVRWMNGYGRAVTTAHGEATRLIGVMYDITERKELEQQKDEFVGVASHELKTPVTSIQAYGELLLERFEQHGSDKDHTVLMQKLMVQVHRLAGLIRDLLDTTRLSEGRLPLHPEQFDLNQLVAEHADDLQRLTRQHRIVFHAEGNLLVTADRERIGQVLINLVSNAIKYSPDGGDIVISTVPQAGMVTVHVQDGGIGIPEAERERVFDRFFRVSGNRMQTFPGMGLGLYISAAIIQRHNGTITAAAAPGKGSVFSFSLPYTADAN